MPVENPFFPTVVDIFLDQILVDSITEHEPNGIHIKYNT